MRLPSARRALPCVLLLGALTAPAAAAASEPVAVAPPFAPEGDLSAAGVSAAAESGCHSRNGILFRDAGTALRYEVRHFGRIRCADDTPLKRVTCFTSLFNERGDGSLDQLSRDEASGRSRCRAGSPYRGSHPAGQRFVERYGYNLTLRRGFQWEHAGGTYCQRTNDRRTLVCRGQHDTLSPDDEVVVRNSSE